MIWLQLELITERTFIIILEPSVDAIYVEYVEAE